MKHFQIEKHADVITALELVKEEIAKEAKRINNAGGEEQKKGNLKPALEAIKYAKAVAVFADKIKDLTDEWKKLETQIDSASPEVKEIVLQEHKTGYNRKVTFVSPKTNFTVKFPNGKIISDPKACKVLAKTIEDLGPEKVASLNLLLAGEPLITRDKSLLKKNPSQIIEIKNGWFIKTHSSTQTKIQYLTRISKLLNIDLVINSTPQDEK